VHDANHVSPDEMKRFAVNELPAFQALELARHLLAGCPDCLDLADQEGLLEDQEDESPVVQRLQLMLRAAQQEVESQLKRGAAQWAVLAPLSPAQRLAMLRDRPALYHWGLFRCSLDACIQAGKMNPVEAVDIACFAAAVVETLDARSYGHLNLNDFRARAQTALANAKRAAADFRGAESAFRDAWRHVAAGTGDAYERANVLCHQALLLRDLGDFEAAVALLDDAYVMYEQVNDAHLCGRVLIQQASSIGFVDPLQGIELARRGLAKLDLQNGDPYLELSARNVLAHFLNDAGFPEEARAIQEELRPLYARFPGVAVQSRMAWLDGLIARNLGDFSTAEQKLRDLCALFSKHNFDLELALVSLDLAEILLWSRRHAEAAQIIHGTYPVLVSWGLDKDLLALWLTLENCVQAQTEEATLLMHEMASALRRGWNRRRTA
jgi:tetratricopeptide (TPR) repeat protein